MSKKALPTDASGFVVLSEYVPHILQEIRYHSTYNFIGERIDGYEEPIALLSIEAARALKSACNELLVQGYRFKVFDAYRPVSAVKQFMLWGIEDTDIRMKPYFYPDFSEGLHCQAIQSQPRQRDRSDAARYENRQRGRYGKPLRSVQRGIASGVSRDHRRAI